LQSAIMKVVTWVSRLWCWWRRLCWWSFLRRRFTFTWFRWRCRVLWGFFIYKQKIFYVYKR